MRVYRAVSGEEDRWALWYELCTLKQIEDVDSIKQASTKKIKNNSTKSNLDVSTNSNSFGSVVINNHKIEEIFSFPVGNINAYQKKKQLQIDKRFLISKSMMSSAKSGIVSGSQHLVQFKGKTLTLNQIEAKEKEKKLILKQREQNWK